MRQTPITKQQQLVLEGIASLSDKKPIHFRILGFELWALSHGGPTAESRIDFLKRAVV